MDEERGSEKGRLLDVSNGSSSSTTTTVLFLATFVAVSGSFGFGCACGYSSPAESGIMEDLGLSMAEYSLFASVMAIGGMLGSVVSGKVADIMGRRKALLTSEIFCITGWVAILLAKNLWWLDFGRMSMGFGFGILLYVVNVYVAEITPKNIRGGFAATNQVSICCGVSLMFFIGNIVSWRTLAIIGTLPCFVQILGILFIPESPRWLAKVGHEEELETSLQSLRGKKVDISIEATQIRDYTKAFEDLSKGSFFDMFETRYAHSLNVGVGIILLVQFGGNSGIINFASSIFEAAGCSTIVGTTTLAISQIPFTALGAVLMDKAGRRTLLMVCSGGACLGACLIAVGFLLKNLYALEEPSAILVLVGVLVYGAFFCIGLDGTTWVLISEIFPSNIKGSAGSLLGFSNFLSGLIVSYSFNFLFEWSSPGTVGKNENIKGAPKGNKGKSCTKGGEGVEKIGKCREDSTLIETCNGNGRKGTDECVDDNGVEVEMIKGVSQINLKLSKDLHCGAIPLKKNCIRHPNTQQEIQLENTSKVGEEEKTLYLDKCESNSSLGKETAIEMELVVYSSNWETEVDEEEEKMRKIAKWKGVKIPKEKNRIKTHRYNTRFSSRSSNNYYDPPFEDYGSC